jgi:uncharacterized protein YceK
MPRLRLMVIVVLLAGCTRIIDISGAEWRRTGAGIQQVTFDEVECARDTVNAGDLPDMIVGGVVDAVVVPLEDRRRGAAYDRCMLARGYELVRTAER